MTDLPPAGRVEFLDLSRDERRELLELLSELKPAEWEAPTECPAWSVKGIALHLLGDDLSILSRQRDGVPSRVALEAGARGWDQLFAILDRFNEQLVDALADLSPPLLLELLR